MNVEALRELVELLERTSSLANQLSDETFQLALESRDCALAETAGRLRELSSSIRGGWRGALEFYNARAREEPSGVSVRSGA